MNWKPAAKVALNIAIGAIGMVGAQNASQTVRNATIGQSGITKTDLVEVIAEVRKLPLQIIRLEPTPIKVTTSQSLKDLEKK